MTSDLHKRRCDLIISIPAFFVLSPLVILIAITVRLLLGSPTFFRQTRPGKNGKPFTIYKFRTMANARDHRDRLLQDADRLSAVGKLLRSMSLDEIPEIFNVIKGDMSAVGPRSLKQHLRIKAFYGTSENAVKTQIWIAVKVYLLVAIIKKWLKLDMSLYTILQILSVIVFNKFPLCTGQKLFHI
jgi:lipopolysaccharide/colanic/teichoic acid biosynthesis glycosyltransferase